ncbi:SDR family NAD(P)-dependent oxidoreductase [Brevibacterium album]|uniref:SDR family NAD(P)-dependent oxidoreductase n=1 Tax=Brevibacterium album TaxID=417948 RepID=UPI000554D5DA|nr:SDR family oxidoreductase [Brevibacterium album]
MSGGQQARALAGQVAVVTGASRGLGLEYALTLARAGAVLAIQDLDFSAHGEHGAPGADVRSAQERLDAIGAEYRLAEFDAADEAAMRTFVDAVAQEFGRIDIAVANAGGGTGSIADTRASTLRAADFSKVFSRNVLTAVSLVGAVAPHMKERRYGRIVLVSSQGGMRANLQGSYAHYGSVKAAIISYMRNLAQDLGEHAITVNAVAPGYIGTDRLMRQFEEVGVDVIVDRTALKRIGTPQECAAAVEFLASPGASYVTGSLLTIDGGSVRNGA